MSGNLRKTPLATPNSLNSPNSVSLTNLHQYTRGELSCQNGTYLSSHWLGGRYKIGKILRRKECLNPSQHTDILITEDTDMD